MVLAFPQICPILMLERKNKRLTLLLLFLTVAIAVTYWLGKTADENSVQKNLFSNYDLSSIDRVTLSGTTDSVTLDYKGSRWMVNDRYPADPDMIDVLFATLQQAEPRRPVSKTLQDSVAKQVRQHGVTVMLYSSAERITYFIAGGNETKTQAVFLEPESELTYLMTIPGYRVYVSGIFELPEAGWRNKRVFAFNWRNFSNLELRYPSRPDDSFVVEMEDNYFGIRGMESDTTHLNDFLDGVSLLHVLAYAGSSEQFDSLSRHTPLMSIVVNDVGQRSYHLDVFEPGNRQQVYPARIDGTQWAYLDPESVRSVLRTRDFFKK
jgi:hypothetical protein